VGFAFSVFLLLPLLGTSNPLRSEFSNSFHCAFKPQKKSRTILFHGSICPLPPVFFCPLSFTLLNSLPFDLSLFSPSATDTRIQLCPVSAVSAFRPSPPCNPPPMRFFLNSVCSPRQPHSLLLLFKLFTITKHLPILFFRSAGFPHYLARLRPFPHSSALCYVDGFQVLLFRALFFLPVCSPFLPSACYIFSHSLGATYRPLLPDSRLRRACTPSFISLEDINLLFCPFPPFFFNLRGKRTRTLLRNYPSRSSLLTFFPGTPPDEVELSFLSVSTFFFPFPPKLEVQMSSRSVTPPPLYAWTKAAFFPTSVRQTFFPTETADLLACYVSPLSRVPYLRKFVSLGVNSFCPEETSVANFPCRTTSQICRIPRAPSRMVDFFLSSTLPLDQFYHILV